MELSTEEGQWFVFQGGVRMGPITEDRLRRIVLEGRLGDGTLVWNPGLIDWIPVGNYAPEKTLEARVYLSDGGQVYYGTCDRIGLLGLQASLEPPGLLEGAQVRMNFMWDQDPGATFIAGARVTRSERQGLRIDLRFTELNEGARVSIETLLR